MFTLDSFIRMFVLVYVLAVVFEGISRLTYYRKSSSLILQGFQSILIRCLILTTFFMISMVVWTRMGWLPKKAR
jgi:hypothetical protein